MKLMVAASGNIIAVDNMILKNCNTQDEFAVQIDMSTI